MQKKFYILRTFTIADDIMKGSCLRLSIASTVTSTNFGSVLGLYCLSLIIPVSWSTESTEDCLMSYCTRPKFSLSISVAYTKGTTLVHTGHRNYTIHCSKLTSTEPMEISPEVAERFKPVI